MGGSECRAQHCSEPVRACVSGIFLQHNGGRPEEREDGQFAKTPTWRETKVVQEGQL